MAAYALLWLGGINWGLWGLFNYNLVESLLGGVGLDKLAYILVGLSTVYVISTHKSDCKACGK